MCCSKVYSVSNHPSRICVTPFFPLISSSLPSSFFPSSPRNSSDQQRTVSSVTDERESTSSPLERTLSKSAGNLNSFEELSRERRLFKSLPVTLTVRSSLQISPPVRETRAYHLSFSRSSSQLRRVRLRLGIRRLLPNGTSRPEGSSLPRRHPSVLSRASHCSSQVHQRTFGLSFVYGRWMSIEQSSFLLAVRSVLLGSSSTSSFLSRCNARADLFVSLEPFQTVIDNLNTYYIAGKFKTTGPGSGGAPCSSLRSRRLPFVSPRRKIDAISLSSPRFLSPLHQTPRSSTSVISWVSRFSKRPPELGELSSRLLDLDPQLVN